MTDEPWIATTATVTTCTYQSSGLSTLAFGFQTTKKFLITFDYYVHGRLYSSDFQSDTAVPQGSIIDLSYNPLAPQQNTLGDAPTSTTAGRSPLIAFGIAGSIILSLLWLAILRGCH